MLHIHTFCKNVFRVILISLGLKFGVSKKCCIDTHNVAYTHIALSSFPGDVMTWHNGLLPRIIIREQRLAWSPHNTITVTPLDGEWCRVRWMHSMVTAAELMSTSSEGDSSCAFCTSICNCGLGITSGISRIGHDENAMDTSFSPERNMGGLKRLNWWSWKKSDARRKKGVVDFDDQTLSRNTTHNFWIERRWDRKVHQCIYLLLKIFMPRLVEIWNWNYLDGS